MKHPQRIASALMLALAVLSPAFAATFPDRPIRVVVPFAAGGGADIVARMLAEDMRATLKTAIVIENRPGAGATIGAEQVARSAPDGYTLLFTTGTTHSAGPALFKKLPFDPIKDFAPVALATTGSLLLLVNADSPVHNVKELLDWVKANPSRAFYGHSSSTSHVSGHSLAKGAGVPIVGVPYNGATQVMTDLVGGAVGFTFVDVAASRPFLEGKRLRAIAVTSLKRVSTLPDVPTVAESGFPGFETIAWSGFFAPAGTPNPTVDKLSAAVRTATEKPGFRMQVGKATGGEATYLGRVDMAEFVKVQLELWTQKIREAGIEPQ